MVKKVMVVDDSNTDRENIRMVLSDVGCVVITASNGKEAVAKAAAEKPAVIFMDVVMPEMDGYETCRQLASNADTKDIPVVFVTSKGEKADRVWAEIQGAKGHVAKPFKSDELIDQLKVHVR